MPAGNRGERLIEDIRDRHIPKGALGIWWLGQASFVVKGADMVVYIDPFLAANPKRIVPPPLTPEQVTNADLVLCTHDHDDHIDPDSLPGIAQASPKAPIVVPAAVRDRVIAMGIAEERVLGPSVEESLTFGPLTVTSIPASHEELDYSTRTGYPYRGYILELNGVTLYHSGDSVMYEGLIERLQRNTPDLALLPINGHDWKRLHENCIGNMSYREAADLAVAVGVDTVVPMHYGMFRHNTEPPGNFVNYLHEMYPEQKLHVMARYEGWVYLKG